MMLVSVSAGGNILLLWDDEARLSGPHQRIFRSTESIYISLLHVICIKLQAVKWNVSEKFINVFYFMGKTFKHLTSVLWWSTSNLFIVFWSAERIPLLKLSTQLVSFEWGHTSGISPSIKENLQKEFSPHKNAHYVSTKIITPNKNKYWPLKLLCLIKKTRFYLMVK